VLLGVFPEVGINDLQLGVEVVEVSRIKRFGEGECQTSPPMICT
jgi:hypothetical protein